MNNNSKSKITENLKDAGLNEKQIQDFFNKSNDTIISAWSIKESLETA